jgi:hypothetical protein
MKSARDSGYFCFSTEVDGRFWLDHTQEGVIYEHN